MLEKVCVSNTNPARFVVRLDILFSDVGMGLLFVLELIQPSSIL